MRICDDRRCATRALPAAPPSHDAARSVWARGGCPAPPAPAAVRLRTGTHWRPSATMATSSG
eukprot:2332306-Pleurochrysis_carterae.AAC.1